MTYEQIVDELYSISYKTACIADSCKNLHSGNIAHKATLLRECSQEVHDNIKELIKKIE